MHTCYAASCDKRAIPTQRWSLPDGSCPKKICNNINKKNILVVNLFNKANDLGPKTLCLHHIKCILRLFYLTGKFYKVEESQQYSSELSDQQVAQKYCDITKYKNYVRSDYFQQSKWIGTLDTLFASYQMHLTAFLSKRQIAQM